MKRKSQLNFFYLVVITNRFFTFGVMGQKKQECGHFQKHFASKKWVRSQDKPKYIDYIILSYVT